MKLNRFIFTKYHRIVILVLLFLVFGSAFVPYQYSSRKAEIRKKKYEELRAIADLKSAQISQWQKERDSEVNFFSGSQPYNQYAKEIVDGSFQNEALLRSSLIKIMSNNRYENIYILDQSGKILFNVLPDENLIDSLTRIHSKEAFQSKHITIQDLYYCKFQGKVQYEVFAPIIHNNQVIAIFLFLTDPEDYLFPVVEDWPVPSKTGEAILARTEGNKLTCISHLRNVDNSKIQFSFPSSRNGKSSLSALRSSPESFEGPDYSGEMVLGDLSKIPGSSWYLIVKENCKEVYSDFHKFFFLTLSLISLAILFVFALITMIYNRRQRDLFKKLLIQSEALHQTQEEYSATLYSIGDGVIVTDKKGKIRHMNPTAENLTGWSEGDAKNSSIEEVFRIIDENTGEKIESPVDKVLREGKIVELSNHTTLVAKKGGEIPINNSGAPIEDKKGNLIGVVLVFTDQTGTRLRRKLIEIRLNMFEFAIHHTLKETLGHIIDEICQFTKSPLGFVHLVMEDQETLQFLEWSTLTKKEFCHTRRKSSHDSIGSAGIWADCVKLRKPVVHNDYENIPEKKGLPDGHPVLVRELVVPVFRDQKIVAVYGIGNKSTDYTDLDVETVSFLADVGWELADQKRQEEMLIQSEKRFAHLFERAPLGYQSLDANGHFIEINKAWTEALGYEREEVIGRWFGEFLAPEYVEKFRERFPLFKQKGKVHSEFEMIHSNGESRYISFEGRIGYKSDGSFEKTHCILQDITERRLIEKKLRESEEKMNSIFKVAPTGIGVVIDRTFVEVNPCFCLMTGYTKKELIGKSTRILYAQKKEFDIVGEEIYTQISQKGSGEVETCWLKKNGSAINVILSVTMIDSLDRSKGFTFNVLDITDRKTTEIALKESERQLSAMVSNLPGFIYRCKNDENWTMLYLSQRCVDVTGYTPEDFINNSKIAFNDVIDEEYRDILRKKWEQTIAEKNFFEYEYRIIRADREVRWVLERGIVVYNNDNQILFLEGYIEDISERKNAEIELREKMDELERFNRTMVGRENKMIDLKMEINDLLFQQHLPAKYNVPNLSDPIERECNN